MLFISNLCDRNKAITIVHFASLTSFIYQLLLKQVFTMATVQYCVLLSHHAAYFQNQPPVYERTPDGKYTCSYMGNLATVDADSESARRNSSARLMWIFTRVRHPFPSRYILCTVVSSRLC
jgi:hypothetical protein